MSIVETKIQTFDTELRDERDYWVAQLSRATGLSNLRLDFPRPAIYSSAKEAFPLTFSRELLEKLRKLTGDSDFLTYTVLMAALKICLHNYTGSSALAVGSPCRRKEGTAAPKPNALAMLDEISAHST